nr:ulp1 protease family, C-terminal catalytic domain-containing protein [Tanacetum cinerariifolium]
MPCVTTRVVSRGQSTVLGATTRATTGPPVNGVQWWPMTVNGGQPPWTTAELAVNHQPIAFKIKFDWTLAKCFQQEGLWECGYNLMKFMHD